MFLPLRLVESHPKVPVSSARKPVESPGVFPGQAASRVKSQSRAVVAAHRSRGRHSLLGCPFASSTAPRHDRHPFSTTDPDASSTPTGFDDDIAEDRLFEGGIIPGVAPSRGNLDIMPVSHVLFAHFHLKLSRCHSPRLAAHCPLPTVLDVHALMHLAAFHSDQSTARFHHGREANNTNCDNLETLQRFASKEKGRRG